jgi:DNA-binding response OmpR family regulator
MGAFRIAAASMYEESGYVSRAGLRPPPARPGWWVRVLVVTATATLGASCAAFVRRAGCSVDLAEGGESGWAAVHSGIYDAVIAEHLMPQTPGLELVRRMRAAGMDQPVILIADSTDASVCRSDFTPRVDAIIVKPFTFYQVMNRLEAVLRPASRSPFDFPRREERHNCA